MLRTISALNFRNLEYETVDFDHGLTLVCGANGQGKTNLLEAIAVLGNLRSFRHASARKMVLHGVSSFRVDGVVETTHGCVQLRQVVEVGPPIRRVLQVNGATVPLERYLAIMPVFVLSRADTDLVEGPPEGRRAMVDRLAFFMEEKHLADLREYKACLRQRNAALARNVADGEMEIWERQTAEAATRVVCRRRRTVEHWKHRFVEYYGSLRGAGFPGITAEYRGESWLCDRIDEEVAEKYRQRYHETRARDRLAGFTLEGPHRHDLLLRTDGRSVRDVLSAGQVKTVAAALCIATLAQVEEKKTDALPVLVDDADAEIDESVLGHLVDLLGSNRQVVMSSAHKDFLSGVVHQGSVVSMVDGSVRNQEKPQEVGS